MSSEYEPIPNQSEEYKPYDKHKPSKPQDIPFYRSLYSRLTYDKDSTDYKKDIASYMEKPTHTFTLYPYYLWVAAAILFFFCLLMSFFIYDTRMGEGFFPVLVNILMYYTSFYALYIGRIERMTIDRKKGRVILAKTNIFLSKIEKVYNFDQVDYIEIVIKGSKKGAYDSRKYFVRMMMKEKIEPVKFGYTWSFERIKYKYMISVAMIKGMVMRKVNESYIKDEATYDDYVY